MNAELRRSNGIGGIMGLVFSLLLFLLVVVIENYIIDAITFPDGNSKNIVKMIVGLLFLIMLLSMLFGDGPMRMPF